MKALSNLETIRLYSLDIYQKFAIFGNSPYTLMRITRFMTSYREKNVDMFLKFQLILGTWNNVLNLLSNFIYNRWLLLEYIQLKAFLGLKYHCHFWNVLLKQCLRQQTIDKIE